MQLDYPLQQHARHRAEPFQLAFVGRAQSILRTAEDCLLEGSGRGLTLLARNEQSLEAPTLVLREVFGAALELSPLQVRLAGVPPHEPIMHVRVNAPASRMERVKRVLRRRFVATLEESHGDTRCVMHAEAPLRTLLGLDAELKLVTLGSALVWTELARYAPCPVDPEPAAA
jgi:hypothetical protein